MAATKMNIVLKALLFAMAACLACVMVSACSGQTDDASEEDMIRIFGVESEGALSMNFVNETGQEIVGIATKESGVADAVFGDNLISDDTPWAADETVTIFCASYDVITEEGTSEDSNAIDIELLPTYDIQLSFADGSTKVLHGITFNEAEVVSVRLDSESGLCYVVYELDGSEASSLDSELAIQSAVAQGEAAARAAEAQTAADAAAEEQSADYGYYDYAYDYGTAGGGDSYDAGAGAGGGSVDQTQDSCINPDDLILNE